MPASAEADSPPCSRMASATAPMTLRALARKRWPCGVSVMPRELRSKSALPSSASSSSMLFVNALCAMLSMREAAATEPLSATATK